MSRRFTPPLAGHRPQVPGFLRAGADRPPAGGIKRPAAIFAALAAVAVAAGSWYTAARAVTWVEQSTQEALGSALTATGSDWARVETDGMRVTLGGEAPDEGQRIAAIEAVTELLPAERLTDAITVRNDSAVVPPVFTLDLLRRGETLSVAGLVPAGESRDEIAARAEALAPGAVTDMLEGAAFDPPPGWHLAIAFALTALEKLEQSKISVRPDAVTITATLPDQATARRLTDELAAAAPQGIRLDLALQAPRPVIAPFAFAASRDAGGRLEVTACSAETEDQRDTILGAVRAAGGVGTIDCAIGLGAPSPDWAAAVAAGLGALTGIGTGSLDMASTDITLTGAPGIDPDAFTAAAVELGTALPGIFSLTPVPPPAPVTDADAPPPPAFTASRSPDSTVRLKGDVGDAIARNAFTAFTRARFGASDITVETEIRPDLPTGWSARVLAGLEALSLLHSGALTVAPDRLTLIGKTATEDAEEQVRVLLGARLGNGIRPEIDITVDPALKPVTARVAYGQCARQIAALLDAAQIGFEPGKSSIAADSLDLLDDITNILRACPGARFEIAGHTDSQGSEGGNLALSQTRADAVVDALLQRGLDTVFMIAKGYGESEPIADNGTEEGRARNRRIEFRLLSDDTATSPAAEGATGAEAPADGDGAEAGDGTDGGEGGGEDGSEGEADAPASETQTGDAGGDDTEPATAGSGDVATGDVAGDVAESADTPDPDAAAETAEADTTAEATEAVNADTTAEAADTETAAEPETANLTPRRRRLPQIGVAADRQADGDPATTPDETEAATADTLPDEIAAGARATGGPEPEEVPAVVVITGEPPIWPKPRPEGLAGN